MTSLDELAALAGDVALPALGGVGDAEVMALQEKVAAVRRRVDVLAAELAAEIARRSTRDLGHGGLAQRTGARTPEKLVQRLTGVSIQQARALVETGRMLTPTSGDGGPAGPISVLRDAVRSGAISIEQSRAITIGLGEPSDEVPESALEPLRPALIDLAPTLAVEELRAHARVLRDEIDLAGVETRARALREKRYLKLLPQDDGMTRLIGLLDPESAARMQTIVDSALSPRRGGPRFVDPSDRSRAERLERDPRTTDQIALDTVIALLDVAVSTDSTTSRTLLGRHGAPVQVLVSARDLTAGSGFARLIGQGSSIPVSAAERRICLDGADAVLFDADGRAALNLGRTRRRFSRRQRIALSARDGGCRRCGRPADQCEAHHIDPWAHGGDTDVDNGILLCRFHHLQIHDTGWRIHRDIASEVWFIPPPDVDPLQRRVAAHPPNPALRRLSA